MQGIITHLNHNRGMYSVELSDGSYTVFELIDSNKLEKGNIISGDLEEFGDCTLFNQTEDEHFEAYIQNIGLNSELAKNRTFLR